MNNRTFGQAPTEKLSDKIEKAHKKIENGTNINIKDMSLVLKELLAMQEDLNQIDNDKLIVRLFAMINDMIEEVREGAIEHIEDDIIHYKVRVFRVCVPRDGATPDRSGYIGGLKGTVVEFGASANGISRAISIFIGVGGAGTYHYPCNIDYVGRAANEHEALSRPRDNYRDSKIGPMNIVGYTEILCMPKNTAMPEVTVNGHRFTDVGPSDSWRATVRADINALDAAVRAVNDDTDNAYGFTPNSSTVIEDGIGTEDIGHYAIVKKREGLKSQFAGNLLVLSADTSYTKARKYYNLEDTGSSSYAGDIGSNYNYFISDTFYDPDGIAIRWGLSAADQQDRVVTEHGEEAIVIIGHGDWNFNIGLYSGIPEEHNSFATSCFLIWVGGGLS